MTDFGTDLSCVTDLSEDCRPVSGQLLVCQAIARRLSTPRGRLIDDPNYGYDLTDSLNDDMGPADIAEIQAGATAECLKDERVLSATVTVTLPSTGELTIVINLDLGEGPFDLTLAVKDTAVEIIGVGT